MTEATSTLARVVTLYGIAGLLHACLAVPLLVFAHKQRDAELSPRFAVAMVLLAVALAIAGFGDHLPRWVTVVGTNMALLAAVVVMHAGLVAWSEQGPYRFDRFGWAVVALSGPLFWYWAYIEPDGHLRSAVFSFAAMLLGVRAVLLLTRALSKNARSLPLWLLAALFGAWAAWMATRGVTMLVTTQPASMDRSANPTSWITIFWHIAVTTLLTIAVIWLDAHGLAARGRARWHRVGANFSLVEYFRNKLVLLWMLVSIVTLGVLSEAATFYVHSQEGERLRAARTAELTNDALAQRATLIISQVEMVLHAVEIVHGLSGSAPQFEKLIASLPLDRGVVEGLQVITSEGDVAIPRQAAPRPPGSADGDYLDHHRATPDGRAFIGPVQAGRASGDSRFTVTRRLSNPDGSFAGVVLATVDTESLARQFRDLAGGPGVSVLLLGLFDRKARAGTPQGLADSGQFTIESALWRALQQAPSGRFSQTGEKDGIKRVFAYRTLDHLPLVLLTGVPESGSGMALADAGWLALGAGMVVAVLIALAVMLTREIRRRAEQDSFMSMLNHELKTPMSVIRLTLGGQGVPEPIQQRVMRAVADMSAIIDRCLQTDRLQRGEVLPAAAACRVEEVLGGIQAACAAPHRVSISAPELPACRTDRQLLDVILGNLVDNGLKYAPSGKGLSITAEPFSPRGRAGVRVVVSNAPGSAGMPDPASVFRKYYRAPGARVKTGSGLGLHLAEGLARKLGGWLRYRPGPEDVRFELWIPC